ncbi:hypothetical protein ACOMDM_13695 [Serratia plymuthica]|uniref:hypothetical protein n=1 Tax=Serratia plymuthica TaxID=82996 RepID=UPI003BA1F87E
MTPTLTTERLREILERRSPSLRWGEAEKIAAELLANREAQPVAYAVFADNGNIRIWSTDKGITENVGVPVPLYTVPPAPVVNPEFTSAPAVTIPDKVSCEGFDHKDWVEARNLGQCEGWNAYRAELLAQPVSQGYKLPPHAYRELVNSLRDTAVKYSGTDQLRERLNTALSQFIEPDHPHTRTSAPEGGNGA